MKLQSIAKEAAACREACMEAKVGDPMWLLHHELLLEWLTEPVENRIAYILSEKPKREQARRLRELRPVKGPLPKTADAARAEYDAARAKSDAAQAKADAAWAKADAAGAKSDAAWAKADAAWAKADAWAKSDAAGAKYAAAGAKADAARAKYAAARAKAAAAWAEYDAARAEITALHLAECPDTTWNGGSIFP